jgi:solute carrier family 25 protein 34/35
MQSYSEKAPKVGHQHAYIHHGVFYSIRHIYLTEGLKGLWRGSDAAMVRTAVGSGVQLSCYDSTKRWLLQFPYFPHDSVMTHFSASLLTSVVVCLAMNPFDVIMTRMVKHLSISNDLVQSIFC